MGNYEQLKQAVSDVIKTNGNQEITGAIMQSALLTIISTVGGNSTFAGVANPETNPGTPDQNIFYLATCQGYYVNFDVYVTNNSLSILTIENNKWKCSALNIPGDWYSFNNIGYYVGRNGVISSVGDKTFAITDYIKVKENDIFNYYNVGSLGSAYAITFYDSKKQYVDSKKDFNGSFYIPENVSYIVCTARINDECYLHKWTIEEFIKLIDLQKYVLGIPFNNIGYLDANGSFQSLSNFRTTEYIQVENGQLWKVDVNAIGSAYAFCTYDVNKNKVRVFKNAGTYTIESNEKYIRACGINSDKLSLLQYSDFDKEIYTILPNISNAFGDKVSIGDNSFYKYNNIPSYMFKPGDNGKYLCVNIPMADRSICAIKLSINNFSLNNNTNQLSKLDGTFYMFPDAKSKKNSYFAFIGDIFGLTDENFICNIGVRNNTICLILKCLPNYSAFIIEELRTYFAHYSTSDKVTFEVLDSIDDVTIIQEIKPNILKSLQLSDISDSYVNGSVRYSAYPNVNKSVWNNTENGMMCIKLPGHVVQSSEFTGLLHFEVEINRVTLVSQLNKNATFVAGLAIGGLFTQNGMTDRDASLMYGKKEIFFNKVRFGYKDNNIYLILGEQTSSWQYWNASVKNISATNAVGNPANISVMNKWDIEFYQDISLFSEVTEIDLQYDINSIPNIPVEKVIGISSDVLLLYANPTAIKTYLSNIFDMIDQKSKETPLNCLFIGNSITNFQNGWYPGEDEELPKVSNKRPLCMYNPYTFTSRIWELLNPGALDRAFRPLKYGGNMTFVKATDDEKAIINGTFESNFDYLTNTYNSFGKLGGFPQGVKEFLFTKNINEYIEFKIPGNSKGFSVVANCFLGEKSADGQNKLGATTMMKVYVDGTLKSTESLAIGNATNKRFDYIIDDQTEDERTIKVENAEDGKYMGIWGVESWSDFCVRPINNGMAGNDVATFSGSGFDDWVKNASPDVIFFEACILNDTGTSVDKTLERYKEFFRKCKQNNYLVVVFITHAPVYTSKIITVKVEECPDINDPGQTPRYFLQYEQMLIKLCTQLNIPYINVCQYQMDKYNYNVPADLFVDGIHLSYIGHDMYRKLIDYVFKNQY